MSKKNTKAMVGLGLFTAIVVVLQMLGSFIRFGTFSISLVLVPIVVGAAVYGVGAGAWLGFVFGLVVLFSGDAALFLTVNPFGTIVTVMLKGILSGLFAGLTYKLLEKTNAYVAVIASAIVCPIVNTGVFLLGCLAFFLETVAGWASAAGAASVGSYMLLGLVGLNFVAELAINAVLSPVIIRIIRIGKKS